MLDLAEEAFDQVTVIVCSSVECAPFGGDGPAWDDGLCTAGSDSVHGTLAVIAFVCQHMSGFQPVEKRLYLRDIVALCASQNEAYRIA